MRARSLLLVLGPTAIVVLITGLGIWAPSSVLFAGSKLVYEPRIGPAPSAVVVEVPQTPSTPIAAEPPAEDTQPPPPEVARAAPDQSDAEPIAPPLEGTPATTDMVEMAPEQETAAEQAPASEAAAPVAPAGGGPEIAEEDGAESNPEGGVQTPGLAPGSDAPSELAAEGEDVGRLAALPSAIDETPGLDREAGSASITPNEAPEADVVAALPDATATEMSPPPLAVPEKVFITDAIRRQVDDPEFGQEADPADLAALEAFYADYDGPALWVTSAGLSAAGKTIVEEIGKADEWGLESDFALPSPDADADTAEAQAALEAEISLAILEYARAARGGLIDPKRLSELYDYKPRLIEPGTVLTEIVASGTPDAYLRDLHPKHEQFEKLRQALRQAPPEDVARLKANMNRWRWMPEDLGTFYVRINIPEYMLHVVKDGEVIRSEKIAVGSPGDPTPIFSADLKSIVFNPERVVPHSVIRKDVLPTLQKSRNWFGKSDASVLELYQLTVKNKGKPVDPVKIDWNKVNLAALTFVQAPGPTNILGKVQFLYPNSYDVYLHDTILPQQLGGAARAVGQREPRVANPEKLAALLLAEDKDWTKAKVDKLIADGKTTEVKVGKLIPVHTTYFTAVIAEGGEMETYADVYSLDDAVGATSGAVPLPRRKPDGATASRP